MRPRQGNDMLLWRIRRASLFILLIVFLCRANSNDGGGSSSSGFRTFAPVLNEHGEPGTMNYYQNEEGKWFVQYYDHLGLVDMPVPRHFQQLSEDRVAYELRWNVQNGGNWTERTTLEIIYHSLMEPPVRDESIYEDPHYHPRAALKQHQRNQYYTNPGSSGRRTYQQYVSDNAIAAATAHRASSLAASSAGGMPQGIPVIARKMDTAYGWLRDDVDICEWEGVVCGDFSPNSQYNWNPGGVMTTIRDETTKYMHPEKWTCEHCPDPPPATRVTKLELPYAGLVGTLPDEINMLRYLHRLDLRGNRIYGSIPTTLSDLDFLQYLDLTRNEMTGELLESATGPGGVTFWKDPETGEFIPEPLLQSFPPNIKEIWLGSNQFYGTIPLYWDTRVLLHLDLSKNNFTGSLPRYGRKQLPKLKSLLLEDNQFTGKLPPKWVGMTDLQVIDVGGNRLNGTIPSMYGTLTNLREFNIVGNTVSGTIPTELLKLTKLEALMLSENRLHGTIPAGDDTVPHRAMREPEAGYKWSTLSGLQYFHASDNFLTSTLPPDLFFGLSKSITSLDFAYNALNGTIPREVAWCSHLERIGIQANNIRGTMPEEMGRMNPNLELNFTNNLITGTIPNMFCGGGPTSMNFLYRQHACNAVLCPVKTFHPTGAATLHSGCRPCPKTKAGEKQDPPLSKVLGRTRCDAAKSTLPKNGDVDGDGTVSPREVLRLLFVDTIGRFWGNHFANWIDLDVNECDLYGVTCVNGEVAKLDLVNAAMCSSGDHKSGLLPDCKGIPTEIALLTRMEVLTLSRRQFLQGTIPTEIGLMTKLKYVDISECPYMSGPLPSEMGRLTNLKYFNVIGSSFNQSVPRQLYHLKSLEKLHLSNNIFTGSLPPSSIGHLASIKEIFYSNNFLNGTIPRETGNLSKLENLEMYGNELNGTIPDTLSRCTNLKRIDLFSNKLTGTIPKSLAQIEALQIVHLKLNQLTGTIPPGFGELPFLSWFDLSNNLLYGTIPTTFGKSRSIKDFRLGGNMFYDPIPPALCTNTNVNGGLTTTYGCDGVICPLGTYSESGHATHADKGCKKCPKGETTMYLGSSSCRPFSPEDILSILFDAMQGERWPEELRENWKNRHIDVCYWSGVICDTKGDIVSIGFPIAWDDWANEGLAAPLA